MRNEQAEREFRDRHNHDAGNAALTRFKLRAPFSLPLVGRDSLQRSEGRVGLPLPVV
jgi:hypothetical protein